MTTTPPTVRVLKEAVMDLLARALRSGTLLDVPGHYWYIMQITPAQIIVTLRTNPDPNIAGSRGRTVHQFTLSIKETR